MKKAILIGIAVLIVGAAVATVASYPAIGEGLYDAGVAVETRLYGLEPTVIDVGDSRMAAWIGGPQDAAESVVMIHGYSADKNVWMRFAPHFMDTYRVLIVDLPGHGETPFDPVLRYDTISQAERVVRAMDTLGIQRAHIVGNSMGGFIAARMAHDHPERVTTATLIDAAGVKAPEPSAMEQMLAQGKNPFEVHSREEFVRFYAMTMAQPPWLPGATLDWMADQYIARRQQLTRIFQDFAFTGMLDEQLGEIRVPVLVMWGAKDQLVSLSAANVWVDGIPNAKLIVYPELGHMPMVEAPTRSAADVRTFIQTAA